MRVAFAFEIVFITCFHLFPCPQADLVYLRDHILEYEPDFLRDHLENKTFEVRCAPGRRDSGKLGAGAPSVLRLHVVGCSSLLSDSVDSIAAARIASPPPVCWNAESLRRHCVLLSFAVDVAGPPRRLPNQTIARVLDVGT